MAAITQIRQRHSDSRAYTVPFVRCPHPHSRSTS
jgi:hypothetical protein